MPAVEWANRCFAARGVSPLITTTTRVKGNTGRSTAKRVAKQKQAVVLRLGGATPPPPPPHCRIELPLDRDEAILW